MESKSIGVRFSDELYHKIKASAEDKGITMSAYIKMVMTEHFKKQNKEVEQHLK